MTAKERIIIHYFMFFFCFVILFLWISIHQMQQLSRNSEACVNVSDGWTIRVNGTETRNVDLGNFHFSDLKRGDIISLSRVLPKTSFEYPVLFFFSVYSAVEVYSGGQRIYSARFADYNAGKQVGVGHDIIRLNKLSPGRDVTINMTIAQNGAFSNILPIYMEEAENCIINYLHGNSFQLLCTVFLIVLGLVGLIVGLGAFTVGKHLFPLLVISFTAIAIGMGGLANGSYIELYTGNHMLGSYIEYASFYSFPLFMLITMYSHISNSDRERMFMKFFVIGYAGFLIFVIFLELFEILHVSQTLPVYQAACAVGLVYAFKVAIVRIRSASLRESLVALGFISVFILFLFDLVRNLVTKYGLVNSYLWDNSMLPIGGIIFIVTSLFDYFYFATESVGKTDQKCRCEDGFDIVTGVYNRERAMQYLKRLSASMRSGDSEEEYYAVVIFELPELEGIRVRKGTEQMNEVLSAVARILKKVFSYYGKIGRIGLSRFIVIVPCTVCSKINVLVDVCIRSVTHLKKSFGFPVKMLSSVAFNYEVCADRADNPFEVCNLSEKRILPSILKIKTAAEDSEIETVSIGI